MGLNDPQPRLVRLVDAAGADDPQPDLVYIDETGGQPDGWEHGSTRTGVYYSDTAPTDSNGFSSGLSFIFTDNLGEPTVATVYENQGPWRYHNKTGALDGRLKTYVEVGTASIHAVPPEDGVDEGDTGDYWWDTQSGPGLYRCTDGATNTWAAVENFDGAIDENFPDDGTAGVPTGYGPGSLLCHLNPDDPADGGQWYYNKGTAGAPEWLALPTVTPTNIGFLDE